MWKFLANPLQEMVKANLIQHKILNTSYYIDFFAVNIKVIILRAHTRALGRRWCDKADKNLEKNSDAPMISPIIRE